MFTFDSPLIAAGKNELASKGNTEWYRAWTTLQIQDLQLDPRSQKSARGHRTGIYVNFNDIFDLANIKPDYTVCNMLINWTKLTLRNFLDLDTIQPFCKWIYLIKLLDWKSLLFYVCRIFYLLCLNIRTVAITIIFT